MHMLRKDKDKEEGGSGGLMYTNLEKSSVLQEARTFNETPLNARRCIHILTKILTIINQGETLGKNEATEAFFAMTKLFQSKDVNLRRMVYLVIKDMATIADDVIIVTSSLTKDMTGKEDAFRAPAIRALCKITDSSMLQSIERYMKQAIVDKAPGVSSAALTSALRMIDTSSDLVRRWSNEVQEAATSDSPMVQYHALGVLYHIRRADKLATAKMVHKFTRSALRSPYSYCLLIRVAAKLIEEEGEERRADNPLFEFLENCLRNKNEMVIYEAARAIVGLPRTTAKELAPAVSVLQLFCSSPKATLRFAAVRTLNQVAMRHPAAVTACNLDLEALITDSNRSIATLAITTLLKTGSESSVDRLMKQITSFMSEISDEFKVVVVNSIRALCDKYPRKHTVMMTFLSSMLRDEGGYEFKRAIVDTLIHVIEDNPDSKEAGLTHLCEFIEDCEHAVLATRILHLLGREGPRTMRPGKYIRYIYNRVILEAPQVRAAAVAALAKFGAHCEQLLASVLVLLERCTLDADDEVRDRATFYWYLLRDKESGLAAQHASLILSGMQVSVVGLERALQHYTAGGSTTAEKAFDLKLVPVAETPVATLSSSISEPGGRAGGAIADKTSSSARAAASKQDLHAERLSAVPELAALGPLFKSSEPIELTESETEYVVRAVKHTFADYIVFQFDCTNTLQDQLLEDVSVVMESTDAADFEVVRTVALESLPYGKPGIAYTCVRIPDDPQGITGTLSCTLRFVVKDCDPATGLPDDPEEGYRDEYVLENIEVSVADHVRRVVKPDFAASWNEVGPDNEVQSVYELAHLKTLEETVKVLQQHLGLQACERSERIPDGKSSHLLLLSGLFRGGHDVLVRARLVKATAIDSGVNMEITVRSSDPTVSEIIAAAVG